MRRLAVLFVVVALMASTPALAFDEEPRAQRLVKLLYVVLGPAVAAVAAGTATRGGLDDDDDRATFDTAVRTAGGHLQLTHGLLRASPLTLNHSVALVALGALGVEGFVDVE